MPVHFLPESEVIQEDPTTPKGKRLDHLLYTGIENLTSRVSRNVRTDHYPIIAEFQIDVVAEKASPALSTGAEMRFQRNGKS